MCCFAGNERPTVSNTRIFAKTSRNLATLVYSMRLTVRSDVAMILPLPVMRGWATTPLVRQSRALPEFFENMDRGFPAPAARAFAPQALAFAPMSLKVHSVGAFEASFVPHLRDFGRTLRFHLSDDVWRSSRSIRITPSPYSASSLERTRPFIR